MVSIVVPVYNCEKYLKQSIQSLINQTIFDQLEIVFIDDGSTDKSYKILCEYEMYYPNISVIHQENKGVSEARNTGLKAVHGEYIGFFDADDIARPTLYEKMLLLCQENHADIGIVDYSMVFNGTHEKKHRKNYIRTWNDTNDLLKTFLKDNIICNNPVDKLFSSKIAKEIDFPKGFAIGEDMYYVFQALKLAKCVVIDSTESLYLYYIRSDSAMKSKFCNKHFDAVYLSEKIYNEIRDKQELAVYAEANYIHEICKMLGLLYRSKNLEEYEPKIERYIDKLKKYSFFKAVKYMSVRHVMALELMKISPQLYKLIYTILKIG